MKLKLGLLGLIIDNVTTHNKYTKAFLNLKTVFELEQNENFKFSKEFKLKFEGLKRQYLNFDNDIPLQVIEKYYFLNFENLNKYVYVEYNGNELSDTKIIDLYLKLENYFNEVFALACEIADYYNLEVKLKSDNQKQEFI